MFFFTVPSSLFCVCNVWSQATRDTQSGLCCVQPQQLPGSIKGSSVLERITRKAEFRFDWPTTQRSQIIVLFFFCLFSARKGKTTENTISCYPILARRTVGTQNASCLAALISELTFHTFGRFFSSKVCMVHNRMPAR